MKRKGLLESFKWALRGIYYSFKTQRNMRIHGLIALFVILYSLHLHLSPIKFSILLICISLVIGVEMLNSSIEYLIDITVGIKADYLAGITKDISAGAVLISAMVAAICGFLILGPEVIKFLDLKRICFSALFGVCMITPVYILGRRLFKGINPDLWRISLFFLFFPFLVFSRDIWLPFFFLFVAFSLSFENVAFGRAMAKGIFLEAVLGLSIGWISVLV